MSLEKDILKNTSSDDTLNIYNNEIIGSIALYSVIKSIKSITLAKMMLILPLVLHNELLSYVSRTNTDIKSIEQLLIRKPELLANFNDRFYSLSPVSINSILILSALEVLEITQDGKIHLTEENDFVFSEDKKIIGKRAFKIISGANDIAKLLEDKTENLYLQLRVRL